MSRELFQLTNYRIGKALNISLPPGRSGTCVGATDLCDGMSDDRQGRARHTCMAQRGLSRTKATKAYRAWVYAVSLTARFVPMAIAELRRHKSYEIVRVHTTGDFYSTDYIRRWIAIVKACPEKRFWAYTRSWRVPRLLPALRDLAALPNMSLFWSADRETDRVNGAPPVVHNVRIAYLKSTTTEAIPKYVDLVWKDKRRSVHPEPGVTACPQGMVTPNATPVARCSRCGICTNSAPARQEATVT